MHHSGIFQIALFFQRHRPVACCCLHHREAKPDLEAAGLGLPWEPCEVGAGEANTSRPDDVPWETLPAPLHARGSPSGPGAPQKHLEVLLHPHLCACPALHPGPGLPELPHSYFLLEYMHVIKLSNGCTLVLMSIGGIFSQFNFVTNIIIIRCYKNKDTNTHT